MRHHRLRSPPKERQKIIDETLLCEITGHSCGKDMEISNLADPTDNLLCFQPIDRRLYRRISGPRLFRKCILEFADRYLTPEPQGLHDLELEFRQFGSSH